MVLLLAVDLWLKLKVKARWDFGADTIIVNSSPWKDIRAIDGRCPNVEHESAYSVDPGQTLTNGLAMESDAAQPVELADRRRIQGKLSPFSLFPMPAPGESAGRLELTWILVQVDGKAHNLCGDGFAIWIAKDRAKVGPVFGSVGQ